MKKKLIAFLLFICLITSVFGGTSFNQVSAASLQSEAKKTIKFGEYDSVYLSDNKITTVKLVLNEPGSFELNFKPSSVRFMNAELYDEENNMLGEMPISRYISSLVPSEMNIRYDLDAGTYYLRMWVDFSQDAGNYTFLATQYTSNDSWLEICIKLKKGKSLELGTVFYNSKNRKVKWKSSKKKVVSVNSKGKIKAKKRGTAIIKVYNSAGLFAKIKVKVK